MRKELIYILLSIISFTSCEEYYTPAIDTVEGQLVVEAMITNDLSKNLVRLTRTTSFYGKLPAEAVPGAEVSLMEIGGKVIKATESNTGNFFFNSIPTVGKNYKLLIKLNNDSYESETVTMPPIPSITKFYTAYVEKKEYRTDAFGVPVPYTIFGSELYLDAPSSAEISNYRFSTRTILEWIYNPPVTLGPPPPPPSHYWWSSNYDYGRFNIAGPKQFSQAGEIEKHPVVFLPYDSRSLLKSDTISLGRIIILDQYGTSKGSYDFHEKLNSQFTATGSLLDPIQTQVYGNITCVSDSSKTVFGYFDLNSYKQERFYIFMSGPNPNNSVVFRQIFKYPYIPDTGETVGFPPEWWE